MIDRSKDVGTENEYNPKSESDISEKVVDNYDVWFEGIMVIDSDKTIIKHDLVKNMPEHQGRIIPPYIVIKPRHKSIVEEVIPRVNAIQELRYRILHFRNTLRGNITEIDPDMIANISLGNDKLTPKEVQQDYYDYGIYFANLRVKCSPAGTLKYAFKNIGYQIKSVFVSLIHVVMGKILFLPLRQKRANVLFLFLIFFARN